MVNLVPNDPVIAKDLDDIYTREGYKHPPSRDEIRALIGNEPGTWHADRGRQIPAQLTKIQERVNGKYTKAAVGARFKHGILRRATILLGTTKKVSERMKPASQTRLTQILSASDPLTGGRRKTRHRTRGRRRTYRGGADTIEPEILDEILEITDDIVRECLVAVELDEEPVVPDFENVDDDKLVGVFNDEASRRAESIVGTLEGINWCLDVAKDAVEIALGVTYTSSDVLGAFDAVILNVIQMELGATLSDTIETETTQAETELGAINWTTASDTPGANAGAPALAPALAPASAAAANAGDGFWGYSPMSPPKSPGPAPAPAPDPALTVNTGLFRGNLASAALSPFTTQNQGASQIATIERGASLPLSQDDSSGAESPLRRWESASAAAAAAAAAPARSTSATGKHRRHQAEAADAPPTKIGGALGPPPAWLSGVEPPPSK